MQQFRTGRHFPGNQHTSDSTRPFLGFEPPYSYRGASYRSPANNLGPLPPNIASATTPITYVYGWPSKFDCGTCFLQHPNQFELGGRFRIGRHYKPVIWWSAAVVPPAAVSPRSAPRQQQPITTPAALPSST